MRTSTSMKNKSNLTISVKEITLIGMMVAIIEVCKVSMMGLPNIELTTFWVIMFTLYFGRRILYVIPAFILIEGMMYGFGIWWIMYLYMWPSLALLTYLFRKNDSAWIWSTLSGAYGLFYGLFCSIPYVFMGAFEGSLRAGLVSGFSWWVAGIPWDIVHGVANFLLMLVLYHPVRKVMKLTKFTVQR